MGVIFDLDGTLVDSAVAREARDRRDWSTVRKLVERIGPFDGIIELLSELEELCVVVCIVTSSPSFYCGMVTDACGIDVANRVCYHDTSQHKPSPDPILKAVQVMREEAKDVVAVGDEVKDILAARAAGVSAIGVSWGVSSGSELEAAGADSVCRTVGELRKELLGRIKA